MRKGFGGGLNQDLIRVVPRLLTEPNDFHQLRCLKQTFQVSSLGPPSGNLPSPSALAPALLSAVRVNEQVLVSHRGFSACFICYVTSSHMCTNESVLIVITLHSSATVRNFELIKWFGFGLFHSIKSALLYFKE